MLLNAVLSVADGLGVVLMRVEGPEPVGRLDALEPVTTYEEHEMFREGWKKGCELLKRDTTCDGSEVKRDQCGSCLRMYMWSRMNSVRCLMSSS